MNPPHPRIQPERPAPPASIPTDPNDPSWAVAFHVTNGLRSGWFLVRAADRIAAREAAQYQLASDEVLDEVYCTETWR